ncbi:DUF1350 family protein [Spirulina subsalsa FACHB-351]|uniref:DUF1350 family protein n=1 Tax=Spirulina subsalsa FACHB-351 TaxID=234711 RepID=A0ABT3L909_9CYAN|nr:DUF1350 family protein [Spirulina subsalsa]MCW6037996.1 DUF1350 family protein [Spirulina subsalsa FACHB-351]
MDWQEISGGWVLTPPNPRGIVHFLGGAFIGTAPHITYRWLLEALSQAGYAVIATPFLNTLDHNAIARDVLNRFETILSRLQAKNALGQRYLPIYGIGHSMGCKLHLLIGSLYSVDRVGNILISYNNYPVERAIPFAQQLQLTPTFNLEFTPSPQDTLDLIDTDYQVRRNLIIKFRQDDLDQSYDLLPILEPKFNQMVSMQILPGNHLTPIPMGPDVKWNAGSFFTPLDAVGQWFKQEIYRDLNRLKDEVLRWLNPVNFS